MARVRVLTELQRPDPSARRIGSQISAKTARRHYVAGRLLLREGYAGAAAALFQAALEESVKALALGLPSDPSTDDLFDQAFRTNRQHEARLDLARDFYAGVVPAVGLVLLAAVAIEGLLKQVGRATSSPSILETYRPTVEGLAPELGRAYGLRNRGLYVDWIEGKWTDPTTVESAEVVEQRRVVARYVRAANLVARAESGPLARVGLGSVLSRVTLEVEASRTRSESSAPPAGLRRES